MIYKTSDSTDKFNGQNPLDIAIANVLELLRGQTRAPPGMQNMSKIMAKMSTKHAQTKPLMAPIARTSLAQAQGVATALRLLSQGGARKKK
jgi:hypothetical protein